MDKDLKRHPLSAAFPDVHGDDLEGMRESIAAIGVVDAVDLYQGMVLDGWQRYSIALEVGAKCKFVTFKGTASEAAAYVRAKHRRRNLSGTERAMAEERLEAAHRSMVDGGKKPPPPRTVAQRAADAGVDLRLQKAASAVLTKGIPELIEKVDSKKITARDGAKIAQLTEAQQQKAVAAPPARPHKPSPWKVAKDAPKVEVGASKQALDDANERIAILSEENDRLIARLGLDAGQYTAEERETIPALLREKDEVIRCLRIDVKAISDSRDSYSRECNELKRQCAMYRNQLAARKAA